MQFNGPIILYFIVCLYPWRRIYKYLDIDAIINSVEHHS